MKIRYLTILFFGLFVLSSCPGVNTALCYYSITDIEGGELIPGDTVIAFPVYTNQSDNEWKRSVHFPINVLRGSVSYGICCSYGGDASAEEIRDVGYRRT